MSTYPQQIIQRPGVILILDPSRLLLSFHTPPELHRATASVNQLGLILEESNGPTAAGRGQGEVVNHTLLRYWVRTPTSAAAAADTTDRLIREFGADLEWVGPVYRIANEDGRKALVCPLPNVVIIKPSSKEAPVAQELAALLTAHGLQEVAEKSKYLGEYRYFILTDPHNASSYDVRSAILTEGPDLVKDIHFEYMPMIKPTAVVPNDPLYASQWDMARIQSGGAGITGWDINTGAGVVVCVLDEGCDLTHPDLAFSTPGINLGTMAPDGSPTGNHGTACAGIVGARFNNAAGVSGVAGACQIMPVAFQNWTDIEVASGINWATANGARVISMSFGWNAWNHAIIDPAIQNAFASDVVMCVATHNYDGPITYPATNPLVMACGASDEIDNRKSPTSPDGETWWGSDFGPEISVVAPGVHIPTTDRQGADGYNTGGDYFMTFNGTSSATPHVAGLAALIRGQYPTLTNVQVRSIIERTAEKVGVVAYADTTGYPSGTWNQEMGYGRINALRSLTFADVLIADYPGDTGVEPSTPPGGDFWDFSDIAIRPTDDNVFNPIDPNQSSRVERGQTNYLYVRVTNNGPREANNVTVNVRITPYVGLEFVYPSDWTLVDAMHVSPTPITASFATIPAGGTATAKFTISSTQVEDLWGWSSTNPWHPCLLASVNADNDFAFATASLTGESIIVKRNNLAQRNLSVVDVVPGQSLAFPFVMGNLHNLDKFVNVVVDLKGLPKDIRPLLSLDEEVQLFPRIHEWIRQIPEIRRPVENIFTVIGQSRLQTAWAGASGILTLENGSRFSISPTAQLQNISLKGGEMILRGTQRFVEPRDFSLVMRTEKEPGRLYPLKLQVQIPRNAQPRQQYWIRLAQKNLRGDTVGGASVVYRVTGSVAKNLG